MALAGRSNIISGLGGIFKMVENVQLLKQVYNNNRNNNKKLIIAPPHGLTLTSFFSLSFSVGILMVSLSKVPTNHSGLCLPVIALSGASDPVFMLSCFSRPGVFFPWLCLLIPTLESVGRGLDLSGC